MVSGERCCARWYSIQRATSDLEISQGDLAVKAWKRSQAFRYARRVLGEGWDASQRSNALLHSWAGELGRVGARELALIPYALTLSYNFGTCSSITCGLERKANFSPTPPYSSASSQGGAH